MADTRFTGFGGFPRGRLGFDDFDTSFDYDFDQDVAEMMHDFDEITGMFLPTDQGQVQGQGQGRGRRRGGRGGQVQGGPGRGVKRHMEPRLDVTNAGETIWRPSTDVYETKDSFVIHVDLPGVPKDDIGVEMNENNIIIEGDHKQPYETATARVRERNVGKFRKIVKIPRNIDMTKIETKYENGLLELKIPKTEAAKRKRIQITVPGQQQQQQQQQDQPQQQTSEQKTSQSEQTQSTESQPVESQPMEGMEGQATEGQASSA
jgi:HSP20 family protein